MTVNPIEWQPLPTLWPDPAAWTDVGELMLLVFSPDGVPTWEVRRRTKVGRSDDDLIASGTADTFEAAKAAALFEATAHSRNVTQELAQSLRTEDVNHTQDGARATPQGLRELAEAYSALKQPRLTATRPWQRRRIRCCGRWLGGRSGRVASLYFMHPLGTC